MGLNVSLSLSLTHIVSVSLSLSLTHIVSVSLSLSLAHIVSVAVLSLSQYWSVDFLTQRPNVFSVNNTSAI